VAEALSPDPDGRKLWDRVMKATGC
jgi:hypothetical protein